VAAAKVAAEFAKETDKLVILGGAMGETVLDEDGVKQLAKRAARLRRWRAHRAGSARSASPGFFPWPLSEIIPGTTRPAGLSRSPLTEGASPHGGCVPR